MKQLMPGTNANKDVASQPHTKLKRSGQISVLIVLSILPMFMLLGFVVNVGMMVQAKISLQNAADFAAYAGAASQARIMTAVSHVNYQMRQTYKKFIYKYYVVGNLSLKCFPRPGLPPECTSAGLGTGGTMKWQNISVHGETTGFPGVPMVCISLSTESNPCQLVKAVPIVQQPPCVPIDPTCGALQGAAQAIAAIQQQSCSAGSVINSEILGNWVYATEFNRQLASVPKLTGLVGNDIGLVTEELINNSRIKSLEEFIKEKPQSNVTDAKLKQIEGGPDPAKFERTVLAFKSALGNLNTKVFLSDTITMSEYTNPDPDPLGLQRIQLNDFTTWLAFLDGGDASKGCSMKMEKYPAQPIVGVFRQTKNLIYYGVKLTAKARLLFNPFPFGNPDEGVDLTAYAAAMPFGSRIGPKLKPTDFLVKGHTQPGAGATGEDTFYPGLAMKDGGGTSDYEQTDVLLSFFNDLKTGGTTAGAIDMQHILHGIRFAQLPDQFEIGKYNIPVDAENYGQPPDFHEFLPRYRDNATGGADRPFTFWAPIVTINGNDRFSADLETEVSQIASIAGSVGGSVVQTSKKNLTDSLKSSIGKLLGDLTAQNNNRVAKILDPLGTAFFRTNPPYPGMPGKVGAQDPKTVASQLATSYATEHDGDFFQAGRDGYSVKLIPFRMLTSKPGVLSNDGGETKWAPANNFGGDAGDIGLTAH